MLLSRPLKANSVAVGAFGFRNDLTGRIIANSTTQQLGHPVRSMSARRCEQAAGGQGAPKQAQPAVLAVHKLDAPVARPRIELTMSTMVAGKWREEIVWPIRIFIAIILLRIESISCQVVVKNARRDLVCDDRRGRAAAHVPLSAVVMGRPPNRLSGNFRLVNRRHRLRLARESTLHPTKLRRVERRHLNHC